MHFTRLACRVLPMLCLLFSFLFSQAQNQTINGKVINEADKKPLAGVTVTVKGTKTATVTNEDGSFSLRGLDPGAVLQFTSVGFQSSEVAASRAELVSMKSSESIMSELVVVGYATQKKRDLTGAVSVVDVTKMNKQPSPSISDQLQGQVAGVTITTSGSPGEPAKFRIRGFGSFGTSDPLFVVDGAQTTNINDVNPNDIATMQILKDAGAASIYGSRASNGVVIITTKRGRGKTRIAYDGYYGTQRPKVKNPYNMLNPQDQANLKWIALRNTAELNNETVEYNDPIYGSGAAPVLPDYILPFGKKEGDPAVNPSLYYVNPNYTETSDLNSFYQIIRANKTGTDWMSELFSPAPIQSHNLSASGGTDQGSYLFSMNYFNQQGVLMNTYNKRYTLRANSEYKFNKNVRIGENLSYSIIDNPRIGILSEGNDISMAYRQQPIIPVYDIMGNYAGTTGGKIGQATNPVANRQRSINNKGLANRLFGNVYGEIDFLKSFTFRTSFGGEYYSYSGRYFNYPTYENAENSQSNSYGEYAGSGFNWVWSNTVTYSQSFGDHNLKVVAGTEAINEGGTSLDANTTNYFSFSSDYTTLTTGAGAATHSSGRYSRSLASLIGRIDYNYKGRYLLGATVRRDGSSAFGPDNKYGVFPAFSAGWRLSDENFLKDVKWLQDLKVRGSYGVMGNQANLAADNQFTTFNSDRSSTFYDVNGTSNSLVLGFRQGRYGNLAAKWESQKYTNVGFDATIGNRLLEIVADYYVRSVSDMLYAPELPGTAGAATPPTVNIGKMQTSGFDLSIGTHFDINKDFGFDITGTFTTFKNQIKQIADGIQYFAEESRRFNGSTIIRNEVGHPVSSFYGYKVVGFWNSQAEIDAANEQARKATGNPDAVYQTEAAVGRFRYDDKGAGIVTPESRQFLGNPTPKFNYGLNVGGFWKDLDFNFFFYGVHGNQLWNQVRWWTDFYPSFAGGKSYTALYNSWRPDHMNAKAPIQENAGSFSTNSVPNSYYVENGSYIRLRNVQVGWTFNNPGVAKLGISRLRLYVQGANLFTSTKYTGLDPEIGGGSNTAFGIDEGAYPVVKQFLVGLNVSF